VVALLLLCIDNRKQGWKGVLFGVQKHSRGFLYAAHCIMLYPEMYVGIVISDERNCQLAAIMLSIFIVLMCRSDTFMDCAHVCMKNAIINCL
jgi:hypothetical protein